MRHWQLPWEGVEGAGVDVVASPVLRSWFASRGVCAAVGKTSSSLVLRVFRGSMVYSSVSCVLVHVGDGGGTLWPRSSDDQSNR